jgi:small subunit ribosomal protein S16
MGSKQDAFYRVVVSDSRSTPGGRFVDTVGYYDPGTDPATVKLDVERIDDWIRKGAHPSDTVRSLLDQAREVQA